MDFPARDKGRSRRVGVRSQGYGPVCDGMIARLSVAAASAPRIARQRLRPSSGLRRCPARWRRTVLSSPSLSRLPPAITVPQERSAFTVSPNWQALSAAAGPSSRLGQQVREEHAYMTSVCRPPSSWVTPRRLGSRPCDSFAPHGVGDLPSDEGVGPAVVEAPPELGRLWTGRGKPPSGLRVLHKEGAILGESGSPTGGCVQVLGVGVPLVRQHSTALRAEGRL